MNPPAPHPFAPSAAPANEAAASGPFLSVTQLTKTFGARTALQEVSLTVGSDELVVVLGPTGAGKTTLLRTIAGLETPASGAVALGGQVVTSLPPAARDVALVFQNFSLYPTWSVRRNLEFPLRAPGRNLPPTEISQRVAWAAELLRITKLLDRPAARLSGGEMQRVAIGRAIVRRPRLFLLDEPLTNLDAKLREVLRIELVELRRRLRTPMLFVTHDQAEALSMADRIVVLVGGRVLQTGSPSEVYRRPVSPTVARLLGQPAINLLPVTARAGHWHAGDLPLLPAGDVPADTRRLLGIRPEDLAPTGGTTPATIAVVEHLGATTILLVHWAGQTVHLLTTRQAFRAGDVIYPRLDAAAAILWDAAGMPNVE